MSDQAVLFVFVKDNSLLFEERFFERLGEKHLVFLGGRVEKSEDLEKALEREIKEELGDIKITEFAPLSVTITYPHTPELVISPFIITKWEGEIPEKEKDHDNKLFWIPFEKALDSPLERVRVITQAVKDYLEK